MRRMDSLLWRGQAIAVLNAPFKPIWRAARGRVQSSNVAASKDSDDALANTFHKRILPTALISLSSPEGRRLFKEALDLGGMESYFALSEQFVTQSEPSFCALSSLAMVLNALSFDPKKTWKGSWRWVSEETLQCDSVQVCGHSLEKVKHSGMNFAEFESLAKCHGVPMKSYRVEEKRSEGSLELFRKQIIDSSTSDAANNFIIVNFSRKRLGQTGDGHFSPIGGYHPSKNLVLIMDVARFKYPPFWVNVDDLYLSMTVRDQKSDQARGYFILSSPTAAAVSMAADAADAKCGHDYHHHHHHHIKD